MGRKRKIVNWTATGMEGSRSGMKPRRPVISARFMLFRVFAGGLAEV